MTFTRGDKVLVQGAVVSHVDHATVVEFRSDYIPVWVPDISDADLYPHREKIKGIVGVYEYPAGLWRGKVRIDAETRVESGTCFADERLAKADAIELARKLGIEVEP